MMMNKILWKFSDKSDKWKVGYTDKHFAFPHALKGIICIKNHYRISIIFTSWRILGDLEGLLLKKTIVSKEAFMTFLVRTFLLATLWQLVLVAEDRWSSLPIASIVLCRPRPFESDWVLTCPMSPGNHRWAAQATLLAATGPTPLWWCTAEGCAVKI